jgi:hypothetical protein
MLDQSIRRNSQAGMIGQRNMFHFNTVEICQLVPELLFGQYQSSRRAVRANVYLSLNATLVMPLGIQKSFVERYEIIEHLCLRSFVI